MKLLNSIDLLAFLSKRKTYYTLLSALFVGAFLYFFFSHTTQTVAAPVPTTWQGEYFNNMTLSGEAVYTSSAEEIDYDWGVGGPGNGVSTDEFSARWTGTINVSSGNYRFTARADDGIRVYVDGELVIDEWNVQLATQFVEDIPLSSGEHTVVVEYFDRWWVSSASFSIETVPFAMTVTANEPGLRIVVNGEVQSAPYALESDNGETHTIYAPSVQTTSDGRTVQFAGWSDGGAQEHTIVASPSLNISAAYEVISSNTLFENGFEEGDTSAYPQPNIDIREGNTLEVNTSNPRTGSYSLEMSTGGIQPTSVLDVLFAKRNTIYTRTFVSLPSDYSLGDGAVQNLMVLKTEDFRNGLWVTLGSDYRLSPVYFNDSGEATYPGGFGPEIPRDGSWHEIQARYSVDTENGQLELWLDGQKIAHFTNVNTGLADRDDIGVLTLGSYFSTVANNHTMYFDDVAVSPVFIANASEGFQTTVVARGMFIPTYAAFAPDGRIFVAEKGGRIRVVKDGELLPTPLVTIPNVNTYQDRGLNSIALDPDFESNGYIYAAYTHDVDPDDFTGPKTARVVRFTVTGDTAALSTMEVILGSVVGTPENPSCDDYPVGADCLPSDARTHSIGQIQFMEDGTMLVAQGEGASDLTVNMQAMRAQSLSSLGGKLLRINPDGTGVADNPFYTGDPDDNRSKVYAYGFRNPFRYSIKPGTNTVYIGDVGWGSWEEVNVVQPGRNYGWPCFEGEQYLLGYSIYSLCQTLASTGAATDPLHYYAHPPSSSVVGGSFYTGTEYPVEYQNAFFFGDYARNSISYLRTDENDELISENVRILTESADGPVQIISGPDGNLYYLSINTGQLRRLEYVRDGFRPIAQVAATPDSGPLPLEVQFSSAGSNDPEGQALTYYWNFGDGNFSTEANPSHIFDAAGVYDVRLTVTDPQNLSSSATVQVSAGNAAPTATVLTPLVSDLYRVNQTIEFSGEGVDPEDGAIPSQDMSWEIVMHHCEVITNTCHEHPFLTATGASGDFVAPDHGAGSYFEIILSVRDSEGLIRTASRFLHPEEIPLTLNSDPLRATVVLNGTEIVTPATVNVIVNSEQTLFAPSEQEIEGVSYNFASWSDGGAQNHTFTVGEDPIVVSATYTTTEEVTQNVWNSYDVELQDGSPQATVTDTSGLVSTTLDLYESSNDDGVESSGLLNTYRTQAHPEGFNGLSSYWARVPGTFGEYPYVGKNDTARGTAVGESNAPSPSSVMDMQMSPPENDHLIVAAFIVPVDGNYSVSNLAARRVLGWGSTTTLKVFGPDRQELAAVQADSGEWSSDPAVYDLGELTAGDRIYFAVDRDGDFVGDATEIAWTVTKTDSEGQVQPVISEFSANPTTITAGQEVTLTWDTTNATQVTINNGAGSGTLPVDGSVEVSPTATTTYVLTATNGSSSATREITVTVGSGSSSRTWSSFDIEILSGSPQARVADNTGSMPASLEFYESINDDGVDLGSLFSLYTSGNHSEGFNALESFWRGTAGGYPYIGKSSTDRGTDAGETGAPSVGGSRDLQIHPGENDRLTVVAFIVPLDGEYSVSNLAARRVLGWGDTSTLRVFNSGREQVASVQASSLSWSTNAGSLSLGELSSGDKIYFAVDRDGSFVGDATEIIWTVSQE